MLQGINAAVGIALVWLGLANDMVPVVIVGGMLIVLAGALLVLAWRAQVTQAEPPASKQGPTRRR